MNRLMILAAAATMLGVGKLTTEFVANPQVDLQPSTPGTVQTGHINVSGTVLAGTFYGSSGGTTTKVVSGWATSPTGFVFGGDFRTNSVDGRGIFASALSTTGFNYGGDFRSASVNGRGIFGYATASIGPNIGGEFRTLSDAGRGVVGSALAATGNGIGVFGEATSPTGFAGVFNGRFQVNGSAYVGPRTSPLGANEVLGLDSSSTSWVGMYISSGTGGLPYYGYDNKTYDVYTYLLSNGALGFHVGGSNRLVVAQDGASTMSASTSSANLALAQSGSGGGLTATISNPSSTSSVGTLITSGIGSGLTIQLNNASNGARGLDVLQTGVGPGVFSSNANGNAIWGITSNYSTCAILGDNTTGEAVVGRATSGQSGIGAVVGRQEGDGGYGVRGFVTGNGSIGVLGQVGLSGGVDGYGVRGDTVNASGNAIGVYGKASGATQYAMWAEGRSATTGTKSFVIDDPSDPTHKMIVHYSTEGSEPLNAYSGNATTDATGTAWVTLPSYIEEINRDFRYQLTPIGDFAQAIVGHEIRAGRFQIRTDKPNIKVSWRVEGVRNDPFVKKYGAPDEVTKTGSWKGKYLTPDLYNAKDTEGAFYHHPAAGVLSDTPASPSSRVRHTGASRIQTSTSMLKNKGSRVQAGR